MIKFINLPDYFDLEVLESILFEEKLEIIVLISPFSSFKISFVSFNSCLLVRQFLSLSSDPDDFIMSDVFVDLADVFKLLKNLKSYEND